MPSTVNDNTGGWTHFPHQVLAVRDGRDLAQRLAKGREVDRLLELRIDDEAERIRQPNAFVACVVIGSADEQHRRAAFRLGEECQDFSGRLLTSARSSVMQSKTSRRSTSSASSTVSTQVAL